MAMLTGLVLLKAQWDVIDAMQDVEATADFAQRNMGDLLAVVLAAAETRGAQKQYFKWKSQGNLDTCKDEERHLDELLKKVEQNVNVVAKQQALDLSE